MIPTVPDQRKHKAKAGKSFNDLIDYVEENKSKEPQHKLTPEFANLIDYATAEKEKRTNVDKCLAIRVHKINDVKIASEEMNAVAAKNTRCKDPAYHFILSWPEHEGRTLKQESIFAAAEHAIKALGMSEHQYVIAIHGNTDNTHCHIAVNRVHPITYKSRHVEWANRTLHMAARESEIEHGWSHDNGIYIVQTNGHGKKSIILNPAHDYTLPHAHRELYQKENDLPTWHDPDSLESWLKTSVSRDLKRAISKMDGWNALHSWLSKYDITLTDTGGGGMRIRAISQESGENLELPANKGLRLLKRSDLESRWGPFTSSIETPCVTPDLSNLTQKQINKGVRNVLRADPNHGAPPDHILYADERRGELATERSSGLHELPTGSVDGGRQDSEMPLPDAVQDRMGDEQAGQDPSMRRAGTSKTGSRRSLARDNSKREERKEQRALARADLRQRFAKYQRFVREGDTDYNKRIKEIRDEYRQGVKSVRDSIYKTTSVVKKLHPVNSQARTEAIQNMTITAAALKLGFEAKRQERMKAINSTRLPPLAWREWLYEQSNLGDQAAISALRGIVYQAQRDAKRDANAEQTSEQEQEADTLEAREQQYRKLMARLLEEEKREVAIRAARFDAMRPYEIDSLLNRYAGIQWRVTGNGNIEYSDQKGQHLFTDRGNRLTFDKARVTDQEIQLALVHAQEKFGGQLTLTGDDPIFTARMARIADDMGIKILNPEMAGVIAAHREERIQATAAQIVEQTAEPQQAPTLSNQPAAKAAEPLPLIDNQVEVPEEQTAEQKLRAQVLAIDPRANFVIPDLSDSQRLYAGPVATYLDTTNNATSGFAQHLGRGIYALHMTDIPEHDNDAILEIQYRNGEATVTIKDKGKEKGRND